MYLTATMPESVRRRLWETETSQVNLSGQNVHGNIETDEAQEMSDPRDTKMGPKRSTATSLRKSFYSSAFITNSNRSMESAIAIQNTLSKHGAEEDSRFSVTLKTHSD